MSALTDKTFEQILRLVHQDNRSGYPVLYPPIQSWDKWSGQAHLLDDWKTVLKKPMPLALYARVPFCKTICTFCFLPVTGLGADRAEGYVEAFEKEARLYTPIFSRRPFNSVYLGGGTPNVLNEGHIERLFAAMALFPLVKGSQVAMDTNPEFLTPAQARLIRRLGVNWITIGVQSLDQGVIRRVNRTQTSNKVEEAYGAARQAGIAGINIDLICGLPGQSSATFLRDAETIAGWRPDEIHVYLFKPMTFTPFARIGGTISESDRQAWRKTQKQAMDLLAARGYHPLDEESVALKASRVNEQSHQLYADPFSMLGLGMGSVSLAYGRARYVNTMDQKIYESRLSQGRLPIEKAANLSLREEMINYLLLQFGEREAVSSRHFSRLFKQPLKRAFGPVLSSLKERGLLRQKSGVWETVSDKAYFEIPKALYEPSVIRKLLGELKLKNGD